MGRGTVALLVLLMLAGAALSGVLVLQHHGEPLGSAAEAICDAASGGCDEVGRSEYATLQGVSLGALGLLFYLSLLLLFVLSALAGDATRRAAGGLALLAVGLALVVDVMLLGVQAFAIGAYCALCILTYIVNAAALFLLWSARGGLGAILEAMGQREGRLALTGWLAGSLAVAAAVLVGEVALAQRADARQESILGAPIAAAEAAPSPTTPPVTPASPAEDAGVGEPVSEEGAATAPEVGGPEAPRDAAELRSQLDAARKEAARLRQILDDPRQFAAYQDQKAAADYDNAKRENLELAHAPGKGPESARVQVVEYSDFLCPYCKNLADGFTAYLPQAGGRVRIFFKHYPLDKDCNAQLTNSVHPGACKLALGGVCAQEQGKFWPYHDAVFASPPKDPSEQTVRDLATAAGLDAAAFAACLASPAARQMLDADIAEAQRLGVAGTPVVFVNGKKLPRVADFLRAVESESKRLGLGGPSTQGP